ncbi:TonB-dependent receptor plug domain-containing protein [Asaia astilbis]
MLLRSRSLLPSVARRGLLSLVATTCLMSCGAEALAQTASGEVSTTQKKAPIATKTTRPVAKNNALRTRQTAPVSTGDVEGGNEAIIVTGTREIGKKARDAIAPLDVISHKQIAATGQGTLRDALALLLPSLTTPTAGFDAGAMTDTISLRGLNPNETLVLVDGKRRHNTANIYSNPGPQQGSTASDIDMIPMSAIDHVEVLRDGASAQYGSDAVAGVVNIILKKQARGLHVQSITGITSEGDGFQQGVYLDGGASLGSRGFVHISGDYVHQDHTYRSAADNRSNTYQNNILSQPQQTRESIAVNAGYDLTDTIQLYALGTYAHRYAESYQNYRLASSLNAYPGYKAIYPWGYSPVETLSEDDFELKAGIKGDFRGWHWDVSSVYGRDYDDIGLINSVNLSINKATGRTPTSFDVQGFNNQQWTNDFDFSRKFQFSGWPHSVNFAGGASYRYEGYSVGTGSPDSLYGNGSDALAGTNPGNAGNYSRDVVAGYLDISTYLAKGLQLDLAGRYEHYTDVGDTQNGKVSLRYDITKRIALRGTISNGFHAPTLAQKYYSALNISPTAARGLIGAGSPGALANGSSGLKPERSTNAEGGFIVEPIRNLHVTTDIYQINMRDRIMPGGNISGATAINAMRLNGFALPDNISTWNQSAITANWFGNVASTRTQGLDVTVTYLTKLGAFGRIDWDAAINLNRTRLSHQANNRLTGAPLLNAASVAYLTTAYPRSKIIFGGNWTHAKWTVGLHEIRWGQTTNQLTYYAPGPNQFSTTKFLEYQNKPKWTTNLDVSYRFTPRWSATLGGNNIFAAFPTRVPEGNRYLGAPQYYMSTSQLGINGGYYYLRVNYDL